MADTEKIKDNLKSFACDLGQELLTNREFNSWAKDVACSAGETVLTVVGETAAGAAIIAAGTAAAPFVIPVAAVAAAGAAVGFGTYSLIKWLHR